MYKLLTARTHYYAPAANIVMAVTITGSPTNEELQSAIQKAVYKHEIFSNKVILDQNGDSFYIAVAPKDITLQVREGASKEDLYKLIHEQERIPFNFVHGDLIRFFLLKNHGENKLVLIAHHLAGDGMAMIYLIRDIMVALEDPYLIYDKHPVQLVDDYGFPKDSELKRMVRYLLTQANKSWNKKKKVFTYDEFLKMFHTYWDNRELGVLDDMISGEELKNLVLLCKEYRVTVNSVIAAAFLMASKEENEVGMAVSIRPKGYEGMGNYTSGISIQYEPNFKKTFWQNARNMHKLIYKRLQKNEEKYFVLQFLRGMEPTLIDAVYFNTFAGFRNRTAAKVSDWFGYDERIAFGISNLTRPKIPSTYGKYSIDKIEFVPPLLPNNKTVLGIVTVEDKMTITMQYDKKKDAEKYEKIFEDAINILRLKIDEVLKETAKP